MSKRRKQQPATPEQHRKQLVSLIREATGARTTWDVFSDFVTMAACAISNSVDLAQREKREAEYMSLVGRYDHGTAQLFGKMLGALTLALEAEPTDVLGRSFMELEMGSDAHGQYFTPYSVCQLIAQLAIEDDGKLQRIIARRGYVSVSEPACGAGAMLIAFAEELRARGHNPQRQMYASAMDVERRAALMCYVQLSLLGIPAEVIVGNALSLEIRERWYTPMYVLHGWRLRLLATASEDQADVQVEGTQLTLPGIEEAAA